MANRDDTTGQPTFRTRDWLLLDDSHEAMNEVLDLGLAELATGAPPPDVGVHVAQLGKRLRPSDEPKDGR